MHLAECTWPRREFVAFLGINNQLWSPNGKNQVHLAKNWRTDGSHEGFLFPSLQSFPFVKMGLFVTSPRGQHYCCVVLLQQNIDNSVCFLAHLHSGSKFYLLDRWFCSMTIVRVSWSTQGALVATVLVFILLPVCTVYYTESNSLSQFGIPLVQWFSEPWPAVNDGPTNTMGLKTSCH